MLSSLIITRPLPRRRPRVSWVTMALLAFLSFGALYGGWALITAAPGEAPMGMPLEFLRNTPFTSYFIPGLILFGLFGVGSLVGIALGLARHWSAPYLAFALGVGQMIWIVVQYLLIQVYFYLQPIMFGVGLLIALAAFLWWWAVRAFRT